jgi:hypothetical protein
MSYPDKCAQAWWFGLTIFLCAAEPWKAGVGCVVMMVAAILEWRDFKAEERTGQPKKRH